MLISECPDNVCILKEYYLGDKLKETTISRKRGNIFVSFSVSEYASRPFRYWLKIVPDNTKEGCLFDVVTKEGECFRVKMCRSHGCIAGVESVFRFFGFGNVYATWATQDIAAHRKRWEKKAKTHSWLN